MHWLLLYDLADDYLDRRPPLRSEHLGLASAARERGELFFAGALADPADQALLVFTDQAAAEAFAVDDPYVRNGLVKGWRVRPWNIVIGPGIDPPA
jgi:uncharacterized protein YciI